MALLDVKNLSVDFVNGQRRVQAVKNISFRLEKGETLAIIGESGSGKSVTALSVLQLLPYPTTQHPSGSITFQGQEIVGASQDAMRKIRGDRISMIFQEPMTSLNPLHTIEKQIAEVLYLHKNMSADAARTRVIELLNVVGLEQLATRLNAYPHELSGGQRQRVMIAMALANDPDILIADEPTTAVDVTIQAQILKLIKDLQQRFGMAVLLITHDLNIVRKVADRVAVMYHGEMVEQGSVAEVFAKPQHPYTQMLLSAEPKGQPQPVAVNAPVVLRADHVKVHFPIKKGFFKRVVGVVKAVDDVTLDLKTGETIGIVGESGSGKSSLAFALLRLVQAQGDIVFQGKNIAGITASDMRHLRKDMQMVFQDPYGALSPRMTVGDIIAEGLRVHEKKLSVEQIEQRVAEVLGEVGLEPAMRHRYPHEFSGGQRQRISIARAMILKPKLVVLDEPTSALDMSVQAQIVDLLRGLQAKYGLAYVFISHDLRVIRAMSHRVMVMKAGQVVEQADTETLFNNPQHPYTQKLLKAAIDIDVAETAIPNLSF